MSLNIQFFPLVDYTWYVEIDEENTSTDLMDSIFSLRELDSPQEELWRLLGSPNLEEIEKFETISRQATPSPASNKILSCYTPQLTHSIHSINLGSGLWPNWEKYDPRECAIGIPPSLEKNSLEELIKKRRKLLTPENIEKLNRIYKENLKDYKKELKLHQKSIEDNEFHYQQACYCYKLKILTNAPQPPNL